MKIAVYAIAKNEAKHVERWMETTHLADSVCVIDTGSTDGTFERLHRWATYTSRVSINPFRFDDARNTALALVPDDVNVCVSLDMDEVLPVGWRDMIEAAWKPGTSNAWTTMVTSQGSLTQNFKVHSRHGWRWKYPCHEGLYRSMVRETNTIDLTALVISHLPDEAKPRSIYLEMLAWGEFENPGDPRMTFYYGRELLWAGHVKEAVEKLKRYLTLPSENPWERTECLRLLTEAQRLSA